MMSYRPPFDFCRSSSRSREVLLWRLVLSLAVNLQSTSQYVCVCERKLTLGAFEGWAVFSFTPVDVYSPRHLQRVPYGPEGCC